VSDAHYFYDMEKKLEDRSRPYLDSNLSVVQRWHTSSLSLLGQYSVDLTQTNENTVQKLPELRYTLYDEHIAGPLHVEFDGSASSFTKGGANLVRRVDLDPQLSATFGSSGLSLTPRTGYRGTLYSQGATSSEAVERTYFYAGADLNARISRIFGTDAESGIGRIRHSIEPIVSYLYIPTFRQKNLPQIDAVDAVTAQNKASVSLINRLTAHYKEAKDATKFTTFDVMVLRISQLYDLNIAREPGTAARSRSEVLGELYVKTPKVLSLSATGNFDTYEHVWTSHSEGATVTEGVVTVNLSQQYLRDPHTRFVIGGVALKLGKWDLSTQLWRDVENGKTTEEDYRVHYASQCWGARVSYMVTPGERRLTAMIDLKGLGGK
jgi:LPS-assembly protein